MKKFTFTLAFLFAVSFGFAQQVFFEAYSGYQLTLFDDKNELYEASQGYVPIGFKIAGGHEHVQLGLDYRQHITNPQFEGDGFVAPGTTLGAATDFEETFYGAFIRGNVSTLPAYRFGLIASAGAGYYKPKQNFYLTQENLDAGTPEVVQDYDRKLGYNFYLGFSVPIYAQFHWELGYQLNMVDHVYEGEVTRAGNYQSIHVGFSGNLVFGNTEKKCRRVISSSGRGR